MKFNFVFILLIFTAIGCSNKPAHHEPNLFYVEDFRKSGMTDTEVIQAALDSIPENATLQFNNRDYLIEHTIYIYKSLHFQGPAKIVRAPQVTYKLKEPAQQGDRLLILNSTDGLKIKDYVILTNGFQEYKNSTPFDNVISGIRGDTIDLIYPLGKIGTNGNFPVSTNLYKDLKLFWITTRDVNSFASNICSFENITFDGNRDLNRGSYGWQLNMGIFAQSIGTTTFLNCNFINSPGETVVGHNLEIKNCSFSNLNGSAIHFSIDRQFAPEDKIHSLIEGCRFENTNQLTTSITGHSEGCFTHSNSGGYYTAMNSVFINVGAAVLGQIYPSVSVHDWGTSNILFTENSITTNGRMVYDISVRPGNLENVRIVNNKIYELYPINWDFAIIHWGGNVVLENTVNQ